MKTNSCWIVASSPPAAALARDLSVSDSQYNGLVSKRMTSTEASSGMHEHCERGEERSSESVKMCGAT